jgi:hypothetical protein
MSFIGIRVPHETGRLLSGVDVPGIKQTPSEYHITLLCFEDNLPISDIAAAMEAAYDIISKIKPFNIKTSELPSAQGWRLLLSSTRFIPTPQAVFV